MSVHNRQRAVRVDLRWLRHFADLAVEACMERVKAKRHAVLAALAEVEVTLVSDRTIARVHADFMKIVGPTDVITFPHGEIVISAETARANARRYHVHLMREIALYTVHGLLHLNGFEDASARGAAQMRAVQARLLSTILAQLAPPPL